MWSRARWAPLGDQYGTLLPARGERGVWLREVESVRLRLKTLVSCYKCDLRTGPFGLAG